MFINTNISSILGSKANMNNALLSSVLDALNAETLRKLENEEVLNIRGGFGSLRNHIAFDISEENNTYESVVTVKAFSNDEISLSLESCDGKNLEKSYKVMEDIADVIRKHPSFSLRILTGQYTLSVNKMKKNNFYENENKSMLQAMERLSSGKRINSNQDDNAGIAIASRMTTQIRGHQQYTRNMNDGLSLITTAESSLCSISNILQSMREQVSKNNNSTQQFIDNIHNIIESSSFNGINFLKSNHKSNLQISPIDTLEMEIFSLEKSDFAIEQLSQKEKLNKIDGLLTQISNDRARIGSYKNRLEFMLENLR